MSAPLLTGCTDTPAISFTIPGNPGEGAVNAGHRSVVRGKRAVVLKSKRGRGFASLARTVALVGSGRAGHPIVRECVVVIRSYWPRLRHLDGCTELAMGDVDAPVKAVLDSLEAAGVLEDDALVREVRASKYYDKADPRIEVEVYSLDGTAAPSEQVNPRQNEKGFGPGKGP